MLCYCVKGRLKQHEGEQEEEQQQGESRARLCVRVCEESGQRHNAGDSEFMDLVAVVVGRRGKMQQQQQRAHQ